MILEVQHETRLEYSEPVTEAVTEVRMEPVSDADQSCRSFHVKVSPASEVSGYQDGFSNRVHHFNRLTAHDRVVILAAAVIETHPLPRDLSVSKAAWPLDPDRQPLETLDFIPFRGPVLQTPRLEPLQAELQPQTGDRLADVVTRVSTFINKRFTYAASVTQSTSSIDDVLEKGKGVCQDFSHLMIGLLRSFGIPARYVSGYVHRPEKESQSHAWCEVWLPDMGWVAIDPTNDKQVGERFVKVAVGRDFTDVPPNKGVYRGRASETISVRVQTRELERLPPLSWQEQLPPLQGPLTSLASRLRGGPDSVEAEQQQQQ